jgi:hypothetical protein
MYINWNLKEHNKLLKQRWYNSYDLYYIIEKAQNADLTNLNHCTELYQYFTSINYNTPFERDKRFPRRKEYFFGSFSIYYCITKLIRYLKSIMNPINDTNNISYQLFDKIFTINDIIKFFHDEIKYLTVLLQHNKPHTQRSFEHHYNLVWYEKEFNFKVPYSKGNISTL